ncbi:AsmA-like C-terminal region-containing protein [uncultured Azonexus sp.]|uniref:AsmA-like C-terminal region-containing protein n=1 Tax=uncultured Azonexus sp. TaxID=520307 RepID=UPI00260CBCE7|nr:AsmA-like C-terminal region-containing protein [uncultured Azonexus sp.]
MNSGLVYAKTPIGDEAVRQSTRVVQRNLRMVLVQVDGKMTVGELSAKIGNARLVENAVEELERGGYIVPLAKAAAAWELGIPKARKEQVSAISQFSTFGSGTAAGPASIGAQSQASRFSSFGKPVLPTAATTPEVPGTRSDLEPEVSDDGPVTVSRLPRLLAMGGVALLVFLALLAVFFPYNNYRADIERELGSVLAVPVSVGEVSLKLLPTPHLSLREIRIGAAGEGVIAAIDVNRPWTMLLSGAAGVQDVMLSGASIPVGQLLALPTIAGSQAIPWPAIRQLTLSDFRVDAGKSIHFGPFNGRLLLSSGQLQSATLETPDRSVLIGARPLAEGLDLTMEGRAWRLPGIPVTFPVLQAKVLLEDNRLQLRDIDASFFGGLLKGSWTLNWGDGLAMSGSGEMTRLDLRRVGADLVPRMKAEGDLSGSIRIAARGDDWSALWRNASAQMQIDVTRGLFNGIDVGEAARRGPGSLVRAGATRFDRLQADVGVDAQGVSLRDIRLDAGLLTASGQLQVSAAGEVSGALIALARSSVSTTRVPLAVSGTLPELTLGAGR